VKVLTVADIAFAVHGPVEDVGRVVGFFRKWQQEGTLLLVELQRSLSRSSVAMKIGDIGQPPRRDFIEMVQFSEGASVQEVGLDIPERPFYLRFCLWPERTAGNGLETIIGGEGEETGVVNWLFSIAAADDDLHV